MKLNIARVLLLSFLVMASCGKNSDDEVANIITYGENQFKLYKGYSYKYSETLSTGATPYIIALLGEGVSYNNDAGKFTGTGALIKAYFYSENSAEIKGGEYTIDIFKSKGSFSVDSCFVYVNYNFDVDTGTIYNIWAGIFNVVNLGRLMSYKLDIETADQIRFTGEFKGTVDPL